MHHSSALDTLVWLPASKHSRWVVLCAGLGLFLGFVLLAAWFSGSPAAMRFASDLGKTNAALCLVLGALGLLALLRRQDPLLLRVSRAFAAGCITISALTLAEYATGVDFGIDQLLVGDAWHRESQPFPNRMAPNSALAFVFLGAALLFASSEMRRKLLAAQAFALATFAACGIALIGHLYEVSFLYRPTPFIRMSPFMAMSLIALAVGTLFVRPDIGVARAISSSGISGYLTRRLLALSVLAPVAISWWFILGARAGWYSDGAASALSAVSIVTLFAAVVLFLGRSLELVDAKRTESERYLRDANELTSELARAGTVDDVVRVVMDLGLNVLGASAGGIVRLSEDGQHLNILELRGYHEGVERSYRSFPVTAPLPAAEAIRTRRAVFIESRAEFLERYPSVPEADVHLGHASWAALPLEGRGRLLGAIGLSFARPQTFGGDTGERLARLAWQCAQALDRALLVESEREARERAQVALDAAAIGTYFHDVESGVVEHDRGVKRMFEFREDEGYDLEDYVARIHPDDRAQAVAAFERSRTTGCDFEMRYRLVLPSGTRRWVLDKGRATREASGRARYLTGAMVDFSSEQQAREQAEAASRAKDEFLAMLGHELRNPLSPIVTSLQLMKLRAPGQLEKERAVIERQVQHMIRLVDDLLDVSRITRGKIELRRVSIELSEVVAHAVEITSPLLESRRHRLSIDVPHRGLAVVGDPERLTQVVSNLLTNAAKYTEPNGQIAIEGTRTNHTVVLSVTDSGMGIPKELLPKIFGLFVQSERTIERSQGGLGLGLSLVRSLVELHGGSVSAASDGPGKGSRFTISLPAETEGAPAVPSKPRGSMRSIARLRSHRILVVDDNRDAAESLAEALSGAGHRVRLAFDGPSALSIAGEFRPDIAFLDIGLPVMDGYELARRIRSIPWERSPLLVAVTGYGQPSDRERAIAAGFDAHLVKPVPLDTALELARKGASEIPVS